MDVGDKIAEIGLLVLLPQDRVQFVDVGGGAFTIHEVGKEFFALTSRELHGNPAREHFKVAEAFDLQLLGRRELDRVAQSVQFRFDLFHVDGFGHVARSVELVGVQGVLVVGGDEDDVDLRIDGLQLFRKYHAVHHGHIDVEEGDIHRRPLVFFPGEDGICVG